MLLLDQILNQRLEPPFLSGPPDGGSNGLPILSKTSIQAKLSQRFRDFKAGLVGAPNVREKLMQESPSDAYTSGNPVGSSNSKISSHSRN